MIDQNQLKHTLSYNSESGKFTRNHTTSIISKKDDVVGFPLGKGYLGVWIKGKTYSLHRLAWLYVHGEMPKNQIDHIDRNKQNNRISNLREVTPKQNSQNKSLRKDSKKTGIFGVHYYPKTNRFEVKIKQDGIKIHLGYFKCFLDACCARKSAEIKYDFHKNHGGF